MSISLRCHKCFAEYELDDAMEGRFLACQCGENLTVPGQDAADNKKCPQCANDCDLASVICVNCGHNFKTGQKVESGGSLLDNDEEKSNLWQTIAPLIKPLVILLVIGTIASIIYISVTSKHYGISSAAPLGTLPKLEAHLVSMRLIKDKTAKELPKAFGATAKLCLYVDKQLEEKSRGNINESVFVATDPNGNICAVGGNYMMPDDSIPNAGSKVMRFLRSYWEEAGLLKPQFKEERKGNKLFSYLQETGNAEHKNIKGVWIKKEAGIPLFKSVDTVTILKKELAPEHIFPESKDY